MIIGIVGKANVGKSTFFKATTLADILIANYPFATIDPNKGFGFVRVKDAGPELGVVSNPRTGFIKGDTRFVPVEVIDVAGLVPGAHEGKGMGNKFLDDLRQADAFVHVVDMSGSTTEKGEPRDPGTHDPAFDIRFLEVELDLWITGLLTKGWEKFARQVKTENQDPARALAKQLSGLKVTEEIVNSAIRELKLDPENPLNWNDQQLLSLATRIRKITKPMLIVANKMDIPTSEANLERCKKEFPDYVFVPCSAESELALKEADVKGLISYTPGDKTFTIKGNLNPGQQKALEFIQKNVLDKYGSTGVQQALDVAVFDLLKCIAIFPGSTGKLGDSQGRILPDCFILPPKSTAIDFANKVHTDLAKNFVAAIDVRAKRKIGRDHELKHRDIVEIKTS
jgi:ribosome-binding ATPase YchF (GTP1/OBG family)